MTSFEKDLTDYREFFFLVENKFRGIHWNLGWWNSCFAGHSSSRYSWKSWARVTCKTRIPSSIAIQWVFFIWPKKKSFWGGQWGDFIWKRLTDYREFFFLVENKFRGIHWNLGWWNSCFAGHSSSRYSWKSWARVTCKTRIPSSIAIQWGLFHMAQKQKSFWGGQWGDFIWKRPHWLSRIFFLVENKFRGIHRGMMEFLFCRSLELKIFLKILSSSDLQNKNSIIYRDSVRSFSYGPKTKKFLGRSMGWLHLKKTSLIIANFFFLVENKFRGIHRNLGMMEFLFCRSLELKIFLKILSSSDLQNKNSIIYRDSVRSFSYGPKTKSFWEVNGGDHLKKTSLIIANFFPCRK